MQSLSRVPECPEAIDFRTMQHARPDRTLCAWLRMVSRAWKDATDMSEALMGSEACLPRLPEGCPCCLGSSALLATLLSTSYPVHEPIRNLQTCLRGVYPELSD